MMFAGHPLGRNILGTKKSLDSFNREMVLDFIQRHYAPENLVFCSVGSISENRLKKLLLQNDSENTFTQKAPQRTLVSNYQIQNKVDKKKLFQAHAIFGNRSISMHSDKLTTATILNNILGGPGLNSRLNLNVREKYGFAYNLESFLQPYSDTGAFGIYIGTDFNSLDKAVKLIFNELKKLRENKLGVLQLSKAKTQLIGQIALSKENNINQMISLGKSRLNFEKIDSLEDIHKKIELVTADMLIDMANELFDPKAMSSLIYQPD